jgi:hypothetical protein
MDRTTAEHCWRRKKPLPIEAKSGKTAASDWFGGQKNLYALSGNRLKLGTRIFV